MDSSAYFYKVEKDANVSVDDTVEEEVEEANLNDSKILDFDEKWNTLLEHL